MRKHSISLFGALTIIVCLMLSPVLQVQAGNTYTVKMFGPYRQTDARTMLEMINTFRSSTDAWYWNKDNASKTTLSNLQPLTYDYELEKVAMQRAAELSVIYSHTRPNGKDAFSAYPASMSFGAAGENIAYGYASPQSVFTAWREDNDMYDGQGHRRNMLSSKYTRVGLACFVYEGTPFWVQEFSNSTSSSAYQGPCDEWERVDVELDSSNISGIKLIAIDDYRGYCESIELEVGSKISKGNLRQMVNTTITFNGRVSQDSFIYDDLEDLSIGDTGIAEFYSDYIRGVAPGSTTISATSGITGEKLSIPIEVVAHDINDAYSMTTTSAAYTGKPVTVSEYFSYNGRELKRDVDYTMSYEDNINPGTAKLIVTGIGAFQGSQRIIPITIHGDITKSDLTMEREVAYTGKPVTPKVSLSFNGKTLNEGTDYTVSYENNTEPGMAYVTIRGLGAYSSGSMTRSFTIVKNDSSTGSQAGNVMKKGSTFTYSFGTYKVTSSSAKNPTVTLVKVTTNPKSLKIPDKVYDGNKVAYKVTAIGANACKQKSRLTTLTVGKNITSIGKNAFADCGKLGKMTYQRANIKIGKNAYKRIKSKASVTVKSGTKAEKKAFVKTINKTGGAKNSRLK